MAEMNSRTRIIRPAHRCATPIAALQLNEDISRIETIQTLVHKIDTDSIYADRDEAWKELNLLKQKLALWKRFAQTKLRKEYLSA